MDTAVWRPTLTVAGDIYNFIREVRFERTAKRHNAA